MSEFTITIDAEAVVDVLTRASEGLHTSILDRLAVASTFVAELMRARAPVGVNGALRDSIAPVVAPDALTSEIKPHVSYADAVETGTKPHRPPIDALQAWADMHGINVWALAASIAKKGTQPHPYIKPTYDDTTDYVADIFAAGIDAFLGELAA